MIHSKRYSTTQVLTASPGQVLLQLLRACRRHMAVAKQALHDGDQPAADRALRRASDIVWELQSTLDPSRSPELAASLAEVYGAVSLQLLRAMTQRSLEAAELAESLFAPVADAFESVISQQDVVAA